jgi:hypothetical protein
MFGALAMLVAMGAATMQASAQEANLLDRLVTTRDVVAIRGSGESAEIVYGERRVPVVTREVIGLRGSGESAEIIYGATVYPVLTQPVATITGSGEAARIVYAPIDPAAHEALVARLNSDWNGLVAELNAGRIQLSRR